VNVVGKQRRAVLGSMPEYLGAVRKAFPQRVSVIEDHYVFVDRVPWDGSPEANQGIPTLRAPSSPRVRRDEADRAMMEAVDAELN
jgi:hypothetical protein